MGRPQVFVRFHGCKLHCQYCDTPLTHHKIHKARVETPPYSKKFEEYPLEFTAEGLTQVIDSFGIPSLALTGGEPLEQADFICEWLSPLKGRYDILLETSGVEDEALLKVAPLVSIISMDLKIPSSTGEKPLWDEHEKFIKSKGTTPLYAKVVYDEKMTDEEVDHLKNLIDRFATELLAVVFQPVSPLAKRDLRKCLDIFDRFARMFPKTVRLIPQVHKFLQVL